MSLIPSQKILTGSENLQEVKSLEMCVDIRQDTLDNFGEIFIR